LLQRGAVRFLVQVSLVACLGCGGGSSLDTASPSTSTSYGRVWLTRIPAQDTTEVSAQFGGAAPANVAHDTQFGDCYVEPYSSSSSQTQFESAGTLELLGTMTPWQVQPGSNMGYSSTRTADEWAQGAQLEIRATGSVAPGFDTTVIAPPTLFIQNDRTSLLQAITGNADVTVRWAPVDADQVWMGVESGSVQVACTWTGPSGSGTIPGAALASLPGSGRTIRSPVAINKSDLQSGSWAMSVFAQARSQLPDGSSL
jgi:hypothetical protein